LYEIFHLLVLSPATSAQQFGTADPKPPDSTRRI